MFGIFQHITSNRVLGHDSDTDGGVKLKGLNGGSIMPWVVHYLLIFLRWYIPKW